MREHDLKCWPEPFAAILSGEKRHEVRKNDRGFAVGDVLHLREWDPEHLPGMAFLSRYTGREMRVRVTHLTPGGSWGLPHDVCVMSIAPVMTLDRGNGPEPVLRSFVSPQYAAPPLPEGEHAAWCPQCGPRVAVDEDGCCASCGADATGEGADRAIAAVAELERIRRELSRLSERLEDTFLGGYSDPRDLGIFRHGMGTAATCVEAVLRGDRNQAPIVRPLPEGELAPRLTVEQENALRIASRYLRGEVAEVANGERWATVLDGVAAAPAPGGVLSEEERRALRGVHHWLRGRGVGVNDEDVDPAADVLERLLAASPHPETSAERRAAARAAHEASGRVTKRVGNHEVRELASPRPATLRVGEALMLPEVRDGAMHVSFDYSGDPVVLKAVAGDPHIFWTDDRGYSWEEWSPEPDELLLPCTLIPSEAAP